MIALGCGQTGAQKVGSPRVPTDHLGVGVGAVFCVDRQTVIDALDRFVHTIVGAAGKVDLAQLGKHFQHQIVSIFLLDLRDQRQQQVTSRRLVGGIRQLTSAC